MAIKLSVRNESNRSGDHLLCRHNGIVTKGIAVAALVLYVVPALAHQISCNRACMGRMVEHLLRSMVAHDPEGVPLAATFRATENGHPTIPKFMEAWRTVTKAGNPSLLAVDARAGQAYFQLNVNEGVNTSILWGRIKVVDRKITQLELYIDRSVGDHGAVFSPTGLSVNDRRWMSPPRSRRKATRAQLRQLARSAFDPEMLPDLAVAKRCVYVEMGQKLGHGCMWQHDRPSDPHARIVVIDVKLGIVVVFAVVRGLVQPWQWPQQNSPVSAFVPLSMEKGAAGMGVRDPRQPHIAKMPATAQTAQLLQYYDGKLQGSQLDIYLSGPQMQSDWVTKN